jgi:glycosyltransferase involved in cell wall biosynthesis
VRVLFVALDPPFPATNGHRIRTAEMLKALAADGHAVTFVSFREEEESVDAEALNSLCRMVELVPPTISGRAGVATHVGRLRALMTPLPYTAYRFSSQAMQVSLARHLSTGQFDLIVCDQAFSITNLPRAKVAPIVIDTLQISFVLLRRYLQGAHNPLIRAYAGIEHAKMRRWELAACARASALVACSEIERRQYAALCPRTPVFLVPNVVDTDRFLPVEDPGGLTTLYTGGMDWHPNRDAVTFFAATILPELRALVPGVTFRIAGRTPDEAFRRRFVDVPGLEFTGTVPDMRAEIGRATVCVVPLRIGSGTRLKILEAGAMGKAIVSTRLGAEGLDFRDGEEIVLVDDPRSFAQAVAALLHDAPRRIALGRAARRRVEKEYSGHVLQSALRQCLQEVTAPR